MTTDLVTFDHVTKTYSGITALDSVGFSIAAGEAVCLAGENGSGKSTLIKILAGVEQPDHGRILFAGQPQGALNPRLSAAAGIKVIFQDFSLFPNLSVAENIAFSAELGHGTRLVQRARIADTARATLARIGVDIPLTAAVETLSVAHKQLVAICRALATEARLIIMDEPTTALTEREVRVLLDIIRRLKADGVAVLFVSHKLAEVLEVCEKVIVLRNGQKVAEGPAADFDAASLTRHMTGRDVAEAPPAPLRADAPELMRVEGLSKAGPSRMSALPCARARSWGCRAFWDRAARRWPRRCSGWSRPSGAGSRLMAVRCPLAIRWRRPGRGSAMCPRTG